MKSVKVSAILQSIRKGKLQPVYFLQGNDQFLQQLIIDEVEKILFGSGHPDKTILLPDEMGGREILDRLVKTDLFSSRKLFVLRNPRQIRAGVRQELLDYCDHPVESNVLVIIEEEYSSRTAVIRELVKRFEPVNVHTPFESDLPKWVRYFFKVNQRSVGPKVVEAVMDMAGDSLYHMANEVNKICISTADKDEITVSDVRSFSGWRRDYQRWEFLTAVGNKDITKALKLGRSIISQNETMLSLLYSLTSLFQELLFEKITSGTFKGPTGYTPLSPSVRRKIPRFSKHYSKQEVKSAIKRLTHIEDRLKTISISDESEFSQFLFHTLVSHD